MCSIITTVFTAIACFILYTYMKKKHTEQINHIQSVLGNVNVSLFRTERILKEVEARAIQKDMELKELRAKLEASNSINKDLINMKEAAATEAPKKRGRKPGTKRPYYKKKSGGNPS